MNVVVWCQGLMDDRPVPRFAYVDRTSATREAAAERAFTVINGSVHNLNPVDLELRRRFAALNPGVGLGVGDFVEIDGVVMRCEQRDFTPADEGPRPLEDVRRQLLLEACSIPEDHLSSTDYTIRWPGP